MIFAGLENFSDRPALFSGDKAISYRKLLVEGEKIAAQIPRRSLVLVAASNSHEFISAYVALLRAHMAILLVSETVSAGSLEQLIATYHPEYAFLPQSVPLPGEVVMKVGAYSLNRLRVQAGPELHPDLALLLSTSGTTGSPKLVRLSWTNLAANTKSIVQYLGIGPEDRAITTMPLSYSYGLSILNTHLSVGASTVLTDSSIMNRHFWRLVKELSVTNFGGVPYFYEMLKKLKFAQMDLPALRYLTQAGGQLNADLCLELARLCLAKNMKFYVMYGQTEATARISYHCVTDRPDKAGSIGQPIPGGELWLENDLGQVITSSGVVGELIYRGANVSMGFAEAKEDLSLPDTLEQRLRTGDLAQRDQDGFYYIVGRKNRFLKLFGLRINLMHLEDLLRAKGYDCACTGTDDKLRVFLSHSHSHSHGHSHGHSQTESHGPIDLALIERTLSELTGVHKSGFEINFIDSLPRAASGKIQYHLLQSILNTRRPI